MEAIITKVIKTSAGTIVHVGEALSFTSKGKRYVADVKKIKKKKLVITNIKMDGKPVRGDMIIKYVDID